MMASQKSNSSKRDESIVVAIDKDKGSQYALKWAIDKFSLGKGKSITLLNVKHKPNSSSSGNNPIDDGYPVVNKCQIDSQTKELFLPFRCFCTRKNIQVNEVVIEGADITRALCDYVAANLIENIVLGACSKNSFVRFKSLDVPNGVVKNAPEFCNVYIIAKGKLSSSRNASIPMPSAPFRQGYSNTSSGSGFSDPRVMQSSDSIGNVTSSPFSRRSTEDNDFIRSPFTRSQFSNKSYGELSMPESDISFVSSGRPSTERLFPMLSDSQEMSYPGRLSNGSDTESRLSFGSVFSGSRASDVNNPPNLISPFSQENGGSWSSSSQNLDEVEAEMRRLKQELKQTMDMYSTACKEALSAKQKAMELHRWKMEEQQRLEDARSAEEAALALAEKEKLKCKAAIEAAEAAQRLAELEAQKRINAEMKAMKEADEKMKVLDKIAKNDFRYRKYTIEDIEAATENFSGSRKIGEGGYGPVYRSVLDHTEVAIKVLRPDAAQGRSQFQQEVEVLSCIRHPNMVLLLGACPEYGCLVYEYMANGSLEDCLFRRNNSPALPWQLRFRIAAEIGTGLLFLHQTKPEPLVHRDLKPANILLDRNFVSKISDVGLARLVPPTVADSVTQYRMTSAAGTFCYIDPEYQQTGMLGIKSDIYSLGVMLLQIITAKSPMGLTHHMERSIEKGTFADMLDPAVTDWPVEEALKYAKMALKCTELRRKDRPDLGTEVLPELNRLRALSEESMPSLLRY
ncbi:PREDICTED: U-box domain-containing protein 35-like isoform X2 [Ipomoea nil]|uniref:U-box domain-containing protein 35-like isoform X2 n=1 Tax=Ipomoea nil TaxID=35883 RepID=UPI000901F8F4|nr:PREDICTED: U-box domain-containing protein 35-like isoform X2 [Ipomoea nil]